MARPDEFYVSSNLNRCYAAAYTDDVEQGVGDALRVLREHVFPGVHVNVVMARVLEIIIKPTQDGRWRTVVHVTLR